jgi:anti-sigma-K factor RskA
MTGIDDEDDLPPDRRDSALAAEYVLRLLGPAEDAACVAREYSDPAFAAEVARWQAEFSALDGRFAPARPPAGLRGRIEARLFGARPSALGRIWGSVGLWRGLAALATLAALWLAVPLTRPEAEAPLVAAMAPREGGGEFVARFDPDAGVLELTRLAGAPAPERSLELWALVDGAPVSLGLLDEEDPRTRVALAPEIAGRIGAGTLVEVTEEPEGGSPTGGPTGTVLAVGYLRDV